MTTLINEAAGWQSCGVVVRQSSDGSYFWAVVTPTQSPLSYMTALPDKERFDTADEAWVAGYLFMRKRLRTRE
jgi:hypothetical protein